MPDDPKEPLFKLPPADFNERELPHTASGTKYLRIHRKNRSAIYFSKKEESRWDTNEKGSLGALCVGETLAGILLEIFGNQLRDKKYRSLSDEDIETRTVTTITIQPPIAVVDARGANLLNLGADAQLFAGAYKTSRKWAIALMLHPANPNGLLYPSRHNPDNTNLVLFGKDTVKDSLEPSETHDLKDHPDFKGTLTAYKIAILPKPTPGDFNLS